MLDTSMQKGIATPHVARPRPAPAALAWLFPRQAEPAGPGVAVAGSAALDAHPAARAPAAAVVRPRAHVPHPRRAAAHAAFAAVEGGGPRALDAALAVVEAEARALRLRLLTQEEALKLLRLYATDEWARSVAGQALSAPEVRLATSLPAYLYDPELAETGTCSCGRVR
jgi:hypothetical protein